MSDVKERPILFSGEMVRAILDGRKTQTRRVVKKQPAGEWAAPGRSMCPYGKVGDRLWVRESGWQPKDPTPRDLREGADTWPKYEYSADGISEAEKEQFKKWGWKPKPSIFMPRWASRITLEITNVRIERLNIISISDAKAEGITCDCPENEENRCGFGNQGHFRNLWDKINGKKHPWASNPWVWVVEFRRVFT